MNVLKKIIISFILFLYFNNFSLATDEKSTYLFDAYKKTNGYCSNDIAKHIKNERYDKTNFHCYSTPTPIEHNIFKGEISLQNKKYDLAETYFKEAVDKLKKDKYYSQYNNEYLLYNQLARLSLINKNYKRAIEYSDLAFKSPHLEKEFIETRIKILKNYTSENQKKINPITIISVFGTDEILYDKKEDWETILNALETIDIKYLNNSNFSFGEQLGFTKRQRSKYQTKVNNLRDSLIERAKYELALKYYNDALNNIYQAIQLSDDKEYNYSLYKTSIEILLQKKDFKNAIKILSKMLEIYNENKQKEEIYFFRVFCYIQQKEYDNALDDITKCININPLNIKYYEQKGNILFLKKQYNDALETYKEIIKIDSDYILAENTVSNIMKTQNNYKLALSLLDNLRNDEYFIINEKVNIIDKHLIDTEKYEEAIKELKKIENKNHNHSGLYLSLGICYENLKSYKTALSYYEKAINTKNVDINAYYSRSDLYIKLKNYNKALYDAQKFEKLNYGDARIYDLYYRIYLGLGNYTKALQYLQEYTNNGTYYDELEQIYAMALIKAKLGDISGSLSLINALIDDSLYYNDTDMYKKALKLKKNLYKPAQINIIFNIFISKYH